jgi:hypothetical protein
MHENEFVIAGDAEIEFQDVSIDGIAESEESFTRPLSPATAMSNDIDLLFARDEEILAALYLWGHQSNNSRTTFSLPAYHLDRV